MLGPKGNLIVRPNMADLLTDKTLLFKADPYCIFTFGDQKKASSVCKKGGKRPVWDDEITFSRTAEEMLSVQLWDKDTITKDDFICEGSMKVTSFFGPGIHTPAMDLFSKGKLIGKLLLEIEFKEESLIKLPQTSTHLSQYPISNKI